MLVGDGYQLPLMLQRLVPGYQKAVDAPLPFLGDDGVQGVEGKDRVAPLTKDLRPVVHQTGHRPAVGGSRGVVTGPVRVKDIVLGQMVQGLGVDVPKQAPQPTIQAAGPVRTRLLQQGVGNGAAWPRLGIHAIHPIHQLRQMHLRVRIDGVQDMFEPHGDRCSRVVHTLSFPSIVRPGGLQPFLAILPVYWVPFLLGMFSHISSATGAQRSAVATQRLQ